MKKLAFSSLFLCLIALNPLNAQRLSESQIEQLLIGTWGNGYSVLVDSTGNIQKRIGLFNDEPSDTSYIDSDLVFNRTFEVFTLDGGEKQFYGSRYWVKGDTLQLGNRFWKINHISENELLIREIPSLMSLGGLSQQYFSRLSDEIIETNTAEFAELIQGEWSTQSVQPIKTEGSALYEQQVTITDTLAAPITSPIFVLNFTEAELTMGQEGKASMATFEYHIADGMINSEGLHLFSILELQKESMTLMGIHGTETQGEPLMIWKLKRKKSN